MAVSRIRNAYERASEKIAVEISRLEAEERRVLDRLPVQFVSVMDWKKATRARPAIKPRIVSEWCLLLLYVQGVTDSGDVVCQTSCGDTKTVGIVAFIRRASVPKHLLEEWTGPKTDAWSSRSRACVVGRLVKQSDRALICDYVCLEGEEPHVAARREYKAAMDRNEREAKEIAKRRRTLQDVFRLQANSDHQDVRRKIKELEGWLKPKPNSSSGSREFMRGVLREIVETGKTADPEYFGPDAEKWRRIEDAIVDALGNWDRDAILEFLNQALSFVGNFTDV